MPQRNRPTKNRIHGSQSTLRRRSKNKKVGKTALIICEDSISSPAYFKRLIEYLDLTTAEVKVLGKDCGSAPISVFKEGEKQLDDKDNDFNYYLFVFDRDTHPTYDDAIRKIEGLQNRRKYKNKTTIKAITSVPCFELWLMLHLKYFSTPCGKAEQSAKKFVKDLKKEIIFTDYGKSDCTYFDKIIDKMDFAITNAKKRIAEGENSHPSQHHIDPSTLIYELVEILIEIKASYHQ